MNFKDRLTLWLDQWAIPDWREAWDKLSVRWNVYVGGAAAVWALLPDDIKATIVTATGIPTSWVVIVVAGLTVYFRLKSQTPKE
jgi:hypothetical protein